MTIALIIGRDEEDRKRFSYFRKNIPSLLRVLDPNLDVRSYPDLGEKKDIDFIIAWRPPLGIMKDFPNLKCIASLGAGVDHLLVDTDLPENIPIARIVDPAMSKDIALYVVATVLFYLKRLDLWAENQKLVKWIQEPPYNFLDYTVGIMGLGFLGKHAAETLHNLGIKVSSWSQSKKELPGISQYVGNCELNAFLSQSNVLVCMLPLTPETKNILCMKHFSVLPKGAFLINLARGGHLVEADLLRALDTGQLSGAYLDVFSEEPLPLGHPFWTHPKIRITPHIASVTNLNTALPQILENYNRALVNLPLLNLVDRKKGY